MADSSQTARDGTYRICRFEDVLGEAFHTAFRKASDSPQGTQIYRLIEELPPEDWSRVLEFVSDALAPFMSSEVSSDGE